MLRSRLKHKLFRSDLIKSNLYKRISTHLDNRKNHTLAKGSVLDHITFSNIQHRQCLCSGDVILGGVIDFDAVYFNFQFYEV